MIRIKKNNFDLISTVFSGQCFRMFEEIDKSVTIVLKDRVVNIKECNEEFVISSSNDENLEEIIFSYFDLNRDYNYINCYLSKKDDYMSSIVKQSLGYKILSQDKFEMFITYIISQNNNVKRIAGSVQKLSVMYGKKILFDNKDYYLFPSYEEMKDISLSELRSTGVGFRDKYIFSALNKLKDNPNFLNDIEKLNTEDALEALMEIKGIGLKVASCILLFAYGRFDTFPIDTWVKQNISEHYKEVNDFKSFAKSTFGEYSGLAIQYMFNYERNIK